MTQHTVVGYVSAGGCSSITIITENVAAIAQFSEHLGEDGKISKYAGCDSLSVGVILY
jgi:hypothetical protein